ncbi:patatin-like phospholipase family protein [Nannocystis pusilla]|uniref:patatin-like phospholipase family protein n=1 Tax=Nannocystis pusilla TaxID=889268 RepID=UPI003B77616C
MNTRPTASGSPPSRSRWPCRPGSSASSPTRVLQALEEAGLAPRRIVGVSAGALAGGLWASGLSASELAEELLRLRRADFWDPGLPLGGLLKGGKFAAKLRSLLDDRGVGRVEDCRLPFAAVVYDVASRRVRAVDQGPLGPAIQASCTVPLMFRPLRHEGRLLLDGGVADRLGLCALQPGERALHHAPLAQPVARAVGGGSEGAVRWARSQGADGRRPAAGDSVPPRRRAGGAAPRTRGDDRVAGGAGVSGSSIGLDRQRQSSSSCSRASAAARAAAAASSR